SGTLFLNSHLGRINSLFFALTLSHLIVLTTVNHEGQDAYHPTHSHYPYQVKNPSQIPEDNQNLVQQGTGSCNPQEKIYSQCKQGRTHIHHVYNV
ncbi:hypothetical protein, partial [Salmonella sp. s60368]|uniref:hypothetical protein n=1 Tax=Salmonella sp. s60368 TaxID=3159723 RepID=UPI0039811759